VGTDEITIAFAGSFEQAHIDATVEHLASRKRLFVLQIGAMDGVSFDPVNAAILRHHCRGLLVEPQPEFAEILRRNYAAEPDITIEDCAIAEHDGTATLHRIPAAHIIEGRAPAWLGGIASLYTDRNAIGGVRCHEIAARVIFAHRDSIEVPCLTLASLLKRHAVAEIDILVIDAEGGDWMILRQLDFARYRPSVILFEFMNLPNQERAEAIDRLVAEGYRPYLSGDKNNVLAVLS